MQKPQLPLRAIKLACLKGGGIGSKTETYVNCGGPIAMVPCLYLDNIYIKRKLRVWRNQKCILLVGAKSPVKCASRKTTPAQGRRHRAKNGNLRKFGWTYRHGTKLVPRPYLYQKEATDMERPEMCSPSRCKTPVICAGRQTTPPQGKRYRHENGNLRILGWTYRHGTVFAPRQY